VITLIAERCESEDMETGALTPWVTLYIDEDDNDFYVDMPYVMWRHIGGPALAENEKRTVRVNVLEANGEEGT